MMAPPRAGLRPCGAQSNFITGIDFEWQAELRSSAATWSRGFARPLACCTCFDVHQCFRASPLGVVRSSAWYFAQSMRKSTTKISPRRHGMHWGETRNREQWKYGDIRIHAGITLDTGDDKPRNFRGCCEHS